MEPKTTQKLDETLQEIYCINKDPSSDVLSAIELFRVCKSTGIYPNLIHFAVLKKIILKSADF